MTIVHECLTQLSQQLVSGGVVDLSSGAQQLIEGLSRHIAAKADMFDAKQASFAAHLFSRVGLFDLQVLRSVKSGVWPQQSLWLSHLYWAFPLRLLSL